MEEGTQILIIVSEGKIKGGGMSSIKKVLPDRIILKDDQQVLLENVKEDAQGFSVYYEDFIKK